MGDGRERRSSADQDGDEIRARAPLPGKGPRDDGAPARGPGLARFDEEPDDGGGVEAEEPAGAWDPDDAMEAITGERPVAAAGAPVQAKASGTARGRGKLTAAPKIVKVQSQLLQPSLPGIASLQNTGSEAVELGKPAIQRGRPTHPDDFAVTAPDEGARIEPGGSAFVTVQMTPQVTSPDDPRFRSLTIKLRDPQRRKVGRVRVHGILELPTDAQVASEKRTRLERDTRAGDAPAAPASYDDLARMFAVACDLFADGDEAAAAPLAAAVYAAFVDGPASMARFEARKREAGVSLGASERAVVSSYSHAQEAAHNLSVAARGNYRLEPDLLQTKFAMGEAPLRFLFGDDAALAMYQRVDGALQDAPGDLADATAAYAADAVERLQHGAYYAGVFVGVFEGAYESAKDNVTAIGETVAFVGELLEALFTGGFVAFAEEQVAQLTTALESMRVGSSEIGDSEFVRSWTEGSQFDVGRFRGMVGGYVALELLLVMSGVGAATLLGKFKFLDKLVSKVVPRGLRDKVRRRTPDATDATDRADGRAPDADVPPHRARLRSRDDLDPTLDGAKVADDVPRAVGRLLDTPDEGHAVLSRLAAGDARALEDIGVTNLPRDFDPSCNEWGLWEVREGYVVYRGGQVDFKVPGDVISIGHTHPSHAGGMRLELRGAGDGVPVKVADVVADPAQASHAGLLPSPEDFDVATGVPQHILHTQYVSAGDGVIANPTPGDTRPRVRVRMNDTKFLGISLQKIHYYESKVVIETSSGEVLFEGAMWGGMPERRAKFVTFVEPARSSIEPP